MDEPLHTYFFSKGRMVGLSLMGFSSAAVFGWAAATGSDVFVFTGSGAAGVAIMIVAYSLCIGLSSLYRSVRSVVLIRVTADGLAIRTRWQRLKRIKWSSIRWVEYPWKYGRSFRVRGTSGVFPVYHLSTSDQEHFFEQMTARGIPIQPNEDRITPDAAQR